MDKKIGLAAAAIGVAAVSCIARSEYEKKHFVVENFTICSHKLGTGERRFVFLSDLHNNTFGPNNSQLLSAISKVKPDAVLIGGDMMVCKGQWDMEPALDLVKCLAADYPVYYGNGNHENRMRREKWIYGNQYHYFKGELKAAGVIYLNDQSVLFDENIRITGMDLDPCFYGKFKVPQMEVRDIRRHVGLASKDQFQILLAHSPLFFHTYCRWGADLSLAGHFHGGTIRLPFLGGVMTPQYQFFLPWCAGAFEKNKKHMIVSRGLGTHSINIRLNDKPQLIVLNLKGD